MIQVKFCFKFMNEVLCKVGCGVVCVLIEELSYGYCSFQFPFCASCPERLTETDLLSWS